MRLLKLNDNGELSLVKRTGDQAQKYAILSHTWGPDGDEVSYEDLINGTGKNKPGLDKLRFCAKQADLDGLNYVWIDTCCINKADFTELSGAINSMFRWYQEAVLCYVYLSDVPDPEDHSSTVESFSASRWFKRGWTLQELIAPSKVHFFSHKGQFLGSKVSRAQDIHHITGIPLKILQGESLAQFSIDERFSWAQTRQTTVEEDTAYCLLGIFDIHMTLIYGEGRRKALDRLQRKIRKSNGIPGTAMWTHLEDNKKAKILMWTSTVPFKDNHELAYREHVSGTGDWIFRNSSYISWYRGSSGQILWIHGNVGAGKTKLVAHVIASFLKGPLQVDEALAFFYCNRNEDARRNVASVLRSFVKQLSISSNNTYLHGALAEIYAEKHRSGFSSAELSNEEADTLLRLIMQSYKTVTFIIDALDECDKSSRAVLIERLNSLVHNIPNLRILISSRWDAEIERKLSESKAVLEVNTTKNQDDIKKFVLARLDEDAADRARPLSDQLRSNIVETLFQKSDGMFQWASLQISQLLELERERDIRSSLGSLPQGLAATYDEIYTRLQCQKGSKPIVARRTLQWIFSSHIPLTSDHMLAAVCQGFDDQEPQQVDVTVDFVLSSCSNLVVLDQTNVFRLSHLSVREYFEGNHQELILDGICLTAYVCLRLLIHPNTRNVPPPDLTEHKSSKIVLSQGSATTVLNPLIYYAQHFWPNHCRAMDDTEDPTFLALQMEFIGSLEDTGPAYREWHHAIKYRRTPVAFLGATSTNHVFNLEPIHLALLPICAFGLRKVLQEFDSKSAINVKLTTREGLPLLSLAAKHGHWKIAKLLLDRGANVNTLGAGRSALAMAAEGGNESTIRLLLDHDADVNAKLDGVYNSALSTATSFNRESVVRLLLEHGADVNMVGGVDGSALATVMLNRRESTAKVLLEYGADVNAQLFGGFGEHGSALAAAAKAGNEWGVLLLLEHGVDVNASLYGTYGSALAASVAALSNCDWLNLMEPEERLDSEDLRVAMLLLEHGANVNAYIGGSHGSALAAAASGKGNGSEIVVRMLLEQGADVNAKLSGDYGSALAAAVSRKGSGPVVCLLLDQGADVHTQLSGSYGSALAAAAASEGEESVIRLLLKHGADPNMQLSSKYGSALAAAAASKREDSEAIVRLLLEHGAIANAQLGGDYGSALTAAASKGNESIVRLLLKYGADVNAHAGDVEGSALMAAVAGRWKDREGIIRLLLEHGADVNAQLSSQSGSTLRWRAWVGSAYLGSALAAAAGCRKESIVRLLLENGAKINNKLDGLYGSALAAAAEGGNMKVVRLLLERGAEVNAQLSGDYGSALAAGAGSWVGSDSGRENERNKLVAQLLIEHGADVNAQLSGEYGSALAAAAHSGSERAVQLLIEHGADVNAQLSGEYGSALAAGAWRGCERTVRLLLENGADINAQLSGSYGSALGAAAAGPYNPKKIIVLLLERGADVNARLDGTYGSALATAASCEYDDQSDLDSVVRLLLEYGADVNTPLQGDYGSALAAAAANRHLQSETAVRLMLDHGADVNKSLSGKYGSALAAAAAETRNWPYSKPVVKLLLEHGADVNSRLCGNYGSALAAAAAADDWGRNKSTVQLLLEHGADVNMMLSGNYGNALTAALVMRGSEPIVRLLLEHGAIVNESVLAAASKNEDSRIIPLLDSYSKLQRNG